MIGKPVILYIERAHGESNGPNSDREALSFFLRNDCGCEVRLYDYMQAFWQDKENICKLLKGGWVILVILKQCEYMEREHLEGIEFVRTQISKELPIVVLPVGWENRFQTSAEMPNTYAYDHWDQELVQLVRKLVSGWIRPVDAFGVESDQERDILYKHLENAYRTNYLNGDKGETMLGTPDPNTQVVFEAVRLKLLPIEFVKAEFDDTLPIRKPNFDKVDASVYEEELNNVRLMDEIKRKEFEDDMYRSRGMIPCEGGGGILHWSRTRRQRVGICHRLADTPKRNYRAFRQTRTREVLPARTLNKD